MQHLLEWKNSPYRKPLLMKGIRQVGKTWLLKEFGEKNYQNCVYCNFDENPDFKELFQRTKDPKRLLDILGIISGQSLKPKDTLLIFDEIQECPEALGSLKYFCEEAKEYHLACAGSLLGVYLGSAAFPVGKVDFLNIWPMTFEEFLLADDQKSLCAYLQTIEEIAPLPASLEHLLAEKLKIYFLTGGLPEAILRWVEQRSIDQVQKVLDNIIATYVHDFIKHPKLKEFPKINLVWNSLPAQLARENKKFLYRLVKTGARAREYEDALEWLVNANLVHKVYRASKPNLPLAAYDDLEAFKIYTADVGLLGRLAGLRPKTILEGQSLFTEFKGALTENFVLEALLPQLDAKPRYWSRLNPPYEVDFLIQMENEIFPIEVKADKNIKSRSLKKIQEEFADAIKLKVRISMENLKLDDTLLNIPLYLADESLRLINLALEKISS